MEKVGEGRRDGAAADSVVIFAWTILPFAVHVLPLLHRLPRHQRAGNETAQLPSKSLWQRGRGGNGNGNGTGSGEGVIKKATKK